MLLADVVKTSWQFLQLHVNSMLANIRHKSAVPRRQQQQQKQQLRTNEFWIENVVNN